MSVQGRATDPSETSWRDWVIEAHDRLERANKCKIKYAASLRSGPGRLYRIWAAADILEDAAEGWFTSRIFPAEMRQPFQASGFRILWSMCPPHLHGHLRRSLIDALRSDDPSVREEAIRAAAHLPEGGAE